MTIKRILFAVAALACIALGFFTAQQIERAQYENRVAAIEKRNDQSLADLQAQEAERQQAQAAKQAERLPQGRGFSACFTLPAAE